MQTFSVRKTVMFYSMMRQTLGVTHPLPFVAGPTLFYYLVVVGVGVDKPAWHSVCTVSFLRIFGFVYRGNQGYSNGIQIP